MAVCIPEEPHWYLAGVVDWGWRRRSALHRTCGPEPRWAPTVKLGALRRRLGMAPAVGPSPYLRPGTALGADGQAGRVASVGHGGAGGRGWHRRVRVVPAGPADGCGATGGGRPRRGRRPWVAPARPGGAGGAGGWLWGNGRGSGPGQQIGGAQEHRGTFIERQCRPVTFGRHGGFDGGRGVGVGGVGQGAQPGGVPVRLHDVDSLAVALNPRRQVPGRLDRRVFEHLHVVEQVSVVWFVNPIICCMIGDDSRPYDPPRGHPRPPAAGC